MSNRWEERTANLGPLGQKLAQSFGIDLAPLRAGIEKEMQYIMSQIGPKSISTGESDIQTGASIHALVNGKKVSFGLVFNQTAGSKTGIIQIRTADQVIYKSPLRKFTVDDAVNAVGAYLSKASA